MNPGSPPPDVGEIWSAPHFDAPVLGLSDVPAGEIVLAARALFGTTSSVNRQMFDAATGAEAGEESLGMWIACLQAGDSMAHFSLGYTLYDLGRYKEAYRHLRHYPRSRPVSVGDGAGEAKLRMPSERSTKPAATTCAPSTWSTRAARRPTPPSSWLTWITARTGIRGPPRPDERSCTVGRRVVPAILRPGSAGGSTRLWRDFRCTRGQVTCRSTTASTSSTRPGRQGTMRRMAGS